MTDAGLQPSPDALAILRRAGWSPERTADVNPAHWYGMRDEIEELERVLDTSVCPLGENRRLS